MDKPDNVIANFKVRYEKCEHCDGLGYVNELDGDGYEGEVICPVCLGRKKVEVWS